MKSLPPESSVLDIKITFQCNNFCRFCVAGDNRRIFSDAPAAAIIKTLRKNRSRFDSVRFTGGEPTMRADLPELTACAAECGYEHIILQTNGRLLVYKDFVEALIQAGVNRFAVSIHGHCAGLHDWLTQQKGSFHETALGIRNAIESGLPVATNTVVTKSGYTHLPEIASLLCALGVQQMQFAFPHIQGKALENARQIVPKYSLVAQPLREAVALAAAAGRTALTEGFPFCFLDGIEEHALELKKEFVKTVDPHSQREVGDYRAHRKETLRRLGPSCPACSRADACEGPWDQYPTLFSWKEFMPVERQL